MSLCVECIFPFLFSLELRSVLPGCVHQSSMLKLMLAHVVGGANATMFLFHLVPLGFVFSRNVYE